MNRRDAGLRPRRDPSGAAPWRGATDLPAVRVLAAARGGWDLPLDGDGTLSRGLRDEALRRCLTQRGELQRRVYGATHQLAKRALMRAARCGQRGEHVFGKLRWGSDGSTEFPTSRTDPFARDRSGARFETARIATDLAEPLTGLRSREAGPLAHGLPSAQGAGRSRLGACEEKAAAWPATHSADARGPHGAECDRPDHDPG